ncbi:MAG: 5-formyltetrahydrofolate cyclo-ligase [Deltaproteobacteria bacterium]|nr:5-formyltetrahydrofolate cyclo-ligase [Deltaproteobacteria bacterium]
MNTRDKKKAVRRDLLIKRGAMSVIEVKAQSQRVQERLLEVAEYKRAQRIGLYSHFKGEVQTGLIFTDALSSDKEVFFPRVINSRAHLHMAFFRVKSESELVAGTYGILEPEKKERNDEVLPKTLDLIIIPGIAFDEKCGRIGFGKGFYDRALEGVRCVVAGLAFEEQVLEEIPTEPHDAVLSLVVTEKRVIYR